MSGKNTDRFIIAALCLITGFYAAKIPQRLTITKTKSVKHRIFWSVKPDLKKLAYGKYIRAMVHLDLPKFKCDPCSIVKKVGCKAGDHLEEQGGGFRCNGTTICHVKEGKDPFKFNGVIPDGSVFLIGDSLDSYDSRYFGFIDEEDIDAFLIPIF